MKKIVLVVIIPALLVTSILFVSDFLKKRSGETQSQATDSFKNGFCSNKSVDFKCTKDGVATTYLLLEPVSNVYNPETQMQTFTVRVKKARPADINNKISFWTKQLGCSGSTVSTCSNCKSDDPNFVSSDPWYVIDGGQMETTVNYSVKRFRGEECGCYQMDFYIIGLKIGQDELPECFDRSNQNGFNCAVGSSAVCDVTPTPTSTPTPTGTLTPTPTPTNTLTPTPTRTAACTLLKIFDSAKGQDVAPESLALNQQVVFMVNGTTTHPEGVKKAKFRVKVGSQADTFWCNGPGLMLSADNWCESSLQSGGFFLAPYKVRTSGSYKVEAMVWVPELGWH